MLTQKLLLPAARPVSSSKVVPVDPDASVCASMQISPLYVDSHATVCFGFFFFCICFPLKKSQLACRTLLILTGETQ